MRDKFWDFYDELEELAKKYGFEIDSWSALGTRFQIDELRFVLRRKRDNK